MRIILLLLLGLFCIANAASSQQELWQEAQKAEDENRIEDAIRYLQEASKLQGEYTEEIEISLQAYAEVLGRPELMPQPKTERKTASESEWSALIEVGGYAGQYEQKNSWDDYTETYSGTTANLDVEYVVTKGRFLHTWFLGLALDENIPISATGLSASDSSLDAYYSLDPNLGYSMMWRRMLLGVSVDVSLVQNEDPAPAVSAFTSLTLLQYNSLRWNAGLSAYGGPFTKDQISARTSLSRKVSEGMVASLTLAYIASFDTSAGLDSAVLYQSGAGPELGAKFGWKEETWNLDLGVSYMVFTNFSKDEWNGMIWTKQYNKTKMGANFGWDITDALGMMASLSYQVRLYPNMPTDHPEYYASDTRTVVADLGFSYAL